MESSAASRMPIGFCTHMWTMKNHTLFQSAFQKLADRRGSVNSWMKLPKPMKSQSLE
ncbi:hypothetical protein D3C83_212410 [compost metagenome]